MTGLRDHLLAEVEKLNREGFFTNPAAYEKAKANLAGVVNDPMEEGDTALVIPVPSVDAIRPLLKRSDG